MSYFGIGSNPLLPNREYANLASFPTTGETGYTYVDTSNNKIYRWTGSTYIEMSSASAGSGTVTSVSVTTANGVSGSVTTATTTPAITLTLGAITPTSVAASSTVTGSNLSGTNTGDQVFEYATSASFPGTGTAGQIYVDKSNNLIYRWTGSAYAELSPAGNQISGKVTSTVNNTPFI